MQMSWTDAFKKRVLPNASKAYVAQSQKDMNYESLQPVYALNFINDIFRRIFPTNIAGKSRWSSISFRLTRPKPK